MNHFSPFFRWALLLGSWTVAAATLGGADSPMLATLRASQVTTVSTTYRGGSDPRIPTQPVDLKFVFTVVSGGVTQTVETDGPVVKVTGPDGIVVSLNGSEIAVSGRAAGAPASAAVVMADPAVARLVSDAALAAIAATASIQVKPHPLQREFGPAEENERVAPPLLTVVGTLGVALPDLVEATTIVARQHAKGIVAAAVGAALASGQSPAEAGGGMVARVLRGLGAADAEVAHAAARAAVLGQTDPAVPQTVFVSVVRATLATQGLTVASITPGSPAELLIAQLVGRTMEAVSPAAPLPNMANLLRTAVEGTVTGPASTAVTPIDTAQLNAIITRVVASVVAGGFNSPPPLLATPTDLPRTTPVPPIDPSITDSARTTPVTPIDPNINVSPSGG